MSSCSDDDESSDSLEDISVPNSIKTAPRPSRQPVPAARNAQQNNQNAARSLSPPNSVLSLSGDKGSLQLCLNVSQLRTPGQNRAILNIACVFVKSPDPVQSLILCTRYYNTDLHYISLKVLSF